jgi:dihydrodipicolinate synthase/N-acetylneuraminate lyase
MLPAGVVAGPANLWPREWQYAWRVSCVGDLERMAEVQQLFEQFRACYVFPTGKRSLAALKRGLLRLGVVSSDAVAPGTPALDAEQARAFDVALESLQSEMRTRLPERWCSDPADADDA